MQRTTLIATLGSEAQVVTLALHLLRRMQRRPSSVCVIHTDPAAAPTHAAIERLREAFADEPESTLQLFPILNTAGVVVADTDTPDSAAATFRSIFLCARAIKMRDVRAPLDLCLAGGRKVMSAYAMAVAQLLFDDQDRLWHVLSSGPLLSEKRMTPRPNDDAVLIRLPVLLHADVSPIVSEIADADDPFEAVQRAEARQRRMRESKARDFLFQTLSASERRVVESLVTDGASDAEIAARLSLSQKTVQAHLASAYRKAESHFDLSSVSARSLISLLAGVATSG
jgi:CRISPR-associated protein (TIGR02584 family)